LQRALIAWSVQQRRDSMGDRKGQLIRALCGVVLALSMAPAAMATEGEREECPTWFPDLRCKRDIRFDGFVPPMGMPYLFEEPFVTTGLQFVGIWHDFPDVGAYRGGQAGILALQLRLAITEDLAFIATKDGLVIYRPDTTLASLGATGSASDTLLVDDETGFADVTIGFKYALVKLPEYNFILTPALRYEIPIGQHQVLQRFGKGVIIPSASFAWGIDDLKVIGSLGGQIAMDTKKNSDSLFYNLHLGYRLTDHLVPFLEVNGMHWTRSGDGSSKLRTTLGKVPVGTAQTLLRTGPFEGADYANLGSPGISGKDLVTMAWGLRVPLSPYLSLGASYERALHGKRNSFKQRVTFSVSWDI
jgi:hypothetical protein